MQRTRQGGWLSRLVAGVAVAVGLLPAGLWAQAQPTAPVRPPHYAIQNARIVTGAGQVIEQGTIVMRDGLITAVGRNVNIPAGAWVIDGAGLTVYPGLIDAMSSLGMPSVGGNGGPQGGPGGPGGGGGGADDESYSWGPEFRPATEPWVLAADVFEADDDVMTRWRAAGFTTAVTAPSDGFFPGQSAVVNLAGSRPQDMVVRTPVALPVSLDGGRNHRGYPNSLMGSIAYVRQIFLDADHYDRSWRIYDRSPAGKTRPEYDRALEPLRQAINNGQPVLLPGNEAREIQRAIALGQGANANTVVYGAQEGYRIADEISRSGVPVLVNLNWPRRPANANPDDEESLSVLRFRDRAPTTPAKLHEAGVTFAFYSAGMDDPNQVLRNARLAVAAGLPADAALRAFTGTPAAIFGVQDRVGSLETGKIANVLVTQGDLFAAGSEVKMVFVDGRQFTLEAANVASSGENRRNQQNTQEIAWEAPVPMTQDRGPVREASVTVIQNATILTVSNGTITNGSILIRDGKIAEIGQSVSVPRGADVIDAEGKFVMPGIIDAHSHLAADAINEGSVNSSAMVGIQDVLNPEQIGIYRAVAGGVTSANILHGSANPIGGKNAVVKFRWGGDAAEMMFDGAKPGIKFALGENTKRDRNPDRYPSSRMGVQDVIRQAFIDAQEYQMKWREYEAQVARGNNDVMPPRRDLEMETLVEILEGERLVHAHSYRADEILQLLRTAEEFGFRIATLQHVLEGYRVADEIAAHGAGASTFSDWWAYKVEAYEAIPYNAAIMTERGVVVSINSDSGEEIRHLNQEAAKMMKWGGLSEEDALKLVTLNPAIQLGIQDRVGSLEVGKDADIAIFNEHPLSVYAVPEMTLIDGKVYFDRQHDLELREQLEAEKQALLEKQNRTQGNNRPRVTTDMTIDPMEVR